MVKWLLYSTTKQKIFKNNTFILLFGGFPGSPAGKESACNAGDPRSIPGLGRSTGEGIGYLLQYSWASPVVQLVKNPPSMRETWVWSLGWEDILKKGMATYSSIQAWRIPWTIPWSHRVRQTEWLSLLLFYFLAKQSWINTNCWQNSKVLCIQDKVIH